MAADPLEALLDLPGVADAVTGARGAVDGLLWDRAVNSARTEVIAESAVRGAWANAWFDGVEAGVAQVRSGAAMDGSPMGRVLAGTAALHAALPGLVPVIGSSPAQALARMHTIVASGSAPDSDRGKPRSSVAVDDPLRLRRAPGPAEVAERLAALMGAVRSSAAPGVLVAAVAHAEIADLRPFGWGSGLLSRALIRLILAQRGVDPEMLGAPEVGLRAAGRPTYVRALRAYGDGSAHGVTEILVLTAEAVRRGAEEPPRWLAEG